MSNFEYVHNHPNHRKFIIKMAESKVILFILNTIGLPLYIWAFIANIDNVKSAILFGLAVIMGIIRFYFWVLRAKQNKRLKDLDIKERENQVYNKK